MSDAPVVDIEQPVVTPETKFKRGGFKSSAEVIAEAEAAKAAGGASPQEEPADPVMAAAIEADVGGVTLETPEGVEVTGLAPTPEPEPEAEAPQEEQPEPKFKIMGKEFATQEEAWAYAEELEQRRIADDAFRQGVELAAQAQRGNPAPAPAQPEPPKEIDPLYYTDPQAYFAKMQAEIVAKADEVIERKQKQKQTHDETWAGFYQDYPDLAVARELVDLTLQQNWGTLQHIETKQALKQLAEKTRAKLKPIIEARMPKTQLPKVTTAASPGGQQQVTPAKTQAKPLNFAQQMKNLKKNRAQIR